jgi:hypothetical protein
VGLYASVIRRPEYDRPGRASDWTPRTLSTQLGVEAAFRPQGMANIYAVARATYAGFYSQDLEVNARRLRGYAGLVGLSAIYEHSENLLSAELDQLAVVSPVGPSSHLLLRSGDAVVRVELEAHPVFAAVRPHALVMTPVADDEGLPASLRNRGYYWAWGTRAGASLALDLRRAELGAAVRWTQLSNVEARWIGQSVSKAALRDQRVVALSWLTLPLTNSLAVRVQLERAWANGRIDGNQARAARTGALLAMVWSG